MIGADDFKKNMKLNKTDYLVSSLSAVVGAVPWAGAFLSELFTAVIPNQRFDRLVKYMELLINKLNALEVSYEDLLTRIKDAECIDLLEEGFVQAGRSLNDFRREAVATVVISGINHDFPYSESKFILKLIQELIDEELVWLRFYFFGLINGDDEFRKKYSNVLTPVAACFESDQSEIEKAALQGSCKDHLVRMGLIVPRYKMNSKTGQPEFNENGFIIQSYSATTLGRMVLKHLGVDIENKHIGITGIF